MFDYVALFLLLMNINVLCTSKKLAKIKEIEKRVDERLDQIIYMHRQT
jgi:hypothetical protein